MQAMAMVSLTECMVPALAYFRGLSTCYLLYNDVEMPARATRSPVEGKTAGQTVRLYI